MPDRRRELVDAGIALALQQCFQDLLMSVDTRSITEAAGVTTGSFFHHFRNRSQFTEAVVERFAEMGEASTQRTLDVLESLMADETGNVRVAASSQWAGLKEERSLSGLQHLLWVSRDEPLSDQTTRTGAEVLAQRHLQYDRTLVPACERALAAIGREMLPPFTVEDLLIGMAALANGLEMRQTVEPERVRDGLYGDLVSSVVVAITRPRGELADEVEPAGSERRQVVRPSSPSREPHGATWVQIAEAAAPLFVDRRVGDVKIAEIAEAAGVSASTVYHQFGRVSAVAAAGWARHHAELAAIAAEPLTPREGPVVRMEQVLTRYIQIARENRGALEGLVLETVSGATEGRATAGAVPVTSLIVPHIRELRARGVLRRRIDSVALARSIVQLTAMRVLATPEDPDERIIDDTLGMMLEGALARRVE